MLNVASIAKRAFVRLAASLLVVSLMFFGLGAGAAGAASFVDPALGEITAEQRAVVDTPRPVQLLFTFTTNGKPNARATDYLKKDIVAAVKGTGVFSEVSDQPVEGGAILSITLDNVADIKKAKADGMAIGLTLGLKGKLFTEQYVCVGEYLPDASGDKISRTLNHQIHTTIGMASLPEGVKGIKLTEAVGIMTRQVVQNTVVQLASDPGFGPKADPVPAVAPAVATAQP